MTRELPEWQPFDPSAGSVSTSTTPIPPREGSGRVVVVAPTASVERGGWAGRTAVTLARAWGEEGTKVFLADLSVRRPVLHDVLGVENGEGISDALLYGASIHRIAVSTDEPFFFAPAGTVVADAEPVLGHPRWEVLTQGFAGAGVTLLLYAPLELPGTASLLERASEVVLLATESEVAATELPGADGKVSMVLGPAADAGPDGEPGATYDEGDVPGETALEEPTSAPAAAAEVAGAPGAEPAAEPSGEAAGSAPGAGGAEAAPPAAGASAEPAPAKRSARKRSSRVEVLVLVLVLVLGGAVVGAYYGYLEVPWLSPYLEQLDGGDGESEPSPAQEPPATTSPASPEGEDPADATSPQP